MDFSKLKQACGSASYSGTVYYVSPTGDDANSGKTPTDAWRSLEKINTHQFAFGDAVLFESNGLWRGGIVAQCGVTYSRYGEGALPIISGSARNYAKAELWQKTGYEYVWKCTERLHNVGLMAFDHSQALGNYGDLYGTILFHAPADTAFYEARGGRSLDESDLSHDLQFYSNLKTDELYLYSEKGNPGDRFSSIEIGEQKHLFRVGHDGRADHVTLDGLRFRHTGAHGVSGGGVGCHDLTVRNCVFDWIGGSVLYQDALYGNAIEAYGEVKTFTVENNWCYQIFDTGITFQASCRCEEDVRFEDIRIRNNLVEYCHWAIEYYNQKYTKDERAFARTVKNVCIEENLCRYGGMGWGLGDRDVFSEPGTAKAASATLLCSWGLPEETEHFLVRRNVFDRCEGFLGLIQYLPGGDMQVVFEQNLYIQNKGDALGKYHDARIDARLFGESARACPEIALDLKQNVLKDPDGTVLILETAPQFDAPMQYEAIGNDGNKQTGRFLFAPDFRNCSAKFKGCVVTVQG